MEGGVGERYWCHMCSQTVNPVGEVALQCPFCLNGFVEEMDSPWRRPNESEVASDRALALWAPILLGMMSNPRNRTSIRPRFLDENSVDDENENEERPREAETELDRELDAIIRRRRRSSAAVLQLLQGITAGISAESENYSHGQNPFGSLGDYFVGPGLDLLLHHLAENDPNRYGTPPAQKEAVDALSTVKVGDNLQCPVCLDDFELDAEAKEMPCKHKFHSGCLLPWLELHSSCPVCRFQLPADGSKLDNHHRMEEQGAGPLPWPLNAFSTSLSPSPSSSDGPGAPDDN